jgi:hypothetical protein
MNNREKFEQHAKEVLRLCIDIGVDGEYESDKTRENWLTWQAAQAESAARIVSLQETIVSLEQKMTEAKKDKELLDWLDRHEGAIGDLGYGDYKIYFSESFTAREAIVRAITNTGDKT